MRSVALLAQCILIVHTTVISNWRPGKRDRAGAQCPENTHGASEGEANDMQINENKRINEWPGLAGSADPELWGDNPGGGVAIEAMANEPHNFCWLHFVAKAPGCAAWTSSKLQFSGTGCSLAPCAALCCNNGSCFNEV